MFVRLCSGGPTVYSSSGGGVALQPSHPVPSPLSPLQSPLRPSSSYVSPCHRPPRGPLPPPSPSPSASPALTVASPSSHQPLSPPLVVPSFQSSPPATIQFDSSPISPPFPISRRPPESRSSLLVAPSCRRSPSCKRYPRSISQLPSLPSPLAEVSNSFAWSQLCHVVLLELRSCLSSHLLPS